MALGRKLAALIFGLGTPACADVINSPTLVGIVSTPATSTYTSMEADDAGTGSKLTGLWRFSGAVTFGGATTFAGAAEFSSTIHVVGAATFDSTVTAPHFNTTDSGGLQLGGAAATGLFNDATNISLRVPNSSGALSVQSPSAAAYVPIKALNFQSQDTGTPQFGGAAARGVFTDATSLALRLPGAGSFFFQTTSGAVTLARVEPGGHLALPGGTPSVACGVSPSVTGSDNAFILLTGAAAGPCTVTFAVGFSTTPVCTMNSITGGSVPQYSVTTAAISFSAVASSNYFVVHCIEST